MEEIKLRNGKVALVDDIDFEWLSQFKWLIRYDSKIKKPVGILRTASIGNHSNNCRKKNYHLHREILRAWPWDRRVVDHINGNIFDNRKSNLRICTQAQNCYNSRSSKGTSVYKGVCWNKRLKKWVAYIKKNRKQIYLGVFKKEVDAACAYNNAASELFGSFANLNKLKK